MLSTLRPDHAYRVAGSTTTVELNPRDDREVVAWILAIAGEGQYGRGKGRDRTAGEDPVDSGAAGGVFFAAEVVEGSDRRFAYRFFLCRFFYFFDDITPQPAGNAVERHLLSTR